jgi:hypothetical protein
MLKKYGEKFLCFIFFLFALSACGGGGGGSGGAAITYDYTEGTSSTLSNAASNLLLSSNSSLPYTAPDSTSYASLTAANNTLNSGSYPIASQDTSASVAWADGWTGSGVKVGIADSFNSNGQIDSHGDWVALITNSVAPEASMSFANILGSGGCGGISLTQLATNITAAYDSFESNGYHIVNNSWGIERATRNCDGSYSGSLMSLSDWNTLVDANVLAALTSSATPYDSDMLFIYAAGNSGNVCPGGRLENCNLFAAIFDGIRDAGTSGGHRIMYVGALNDAGNSLTTYSLKAGDMKEDFIVANDNILTSGDADGTSFAAPRVAGAAALLRHKFPNLNGSAIKQILLQTATDMGTSGVDATYGYGRLNIPNAMSPQGSVTPR